MILRGLVGVLIGVGYGVLAGAFTFLMGRVGRDPAYPGPLIPDANEMGRILTFVAMVITGLCGVLVGLVVSLARLWESQAAGIGVSAGLLVLALMALDSWSVPNLANASWRVWLGFLMELIIFPIGLGLLGVVVSIVTGKLGPKHRVPSVIVP